MAGRPKNKMHHVFTRVSVSDSGCWEYTMSLDTKGYGQFIFRGKLVRAHRVAYCVSNMLELVSILHKEILHSCDNPKCCNPCHLSVGSHAENMADAAGKRRTCIGQRNASAKISDSDAAKIMLDSRPQRSIASEYGISQQTVCDIKSGKRRSRQFQ